MTPDLMRSRRASHGTVTERMREQIAMKQLRAKARGRGLDIETYVAQAEQERLRHEEADRVHRLSELLANRIAERVKFVTASTGSGEAAPPEPAPERIPFDDLQGIVDHLLQKKPSA